MTPDLQALLARLTAALAPSTPDRMNYGFPIQLTQVEVGVLVDACAKLDEAARRDPALAPYTTGKGHERVWRAPQ